MDKIIKQNKELKIYLWIACLFSIVLIWGLFNVVAINSNNCKMPVISRYGTPDDLHFNVEAFDEANLGFLGDFITIGDSIYSLGDIMMWGSFITLIITAFFVIRWRIRKT
ncbi:MAG: hypothetical protein AABY22_23565 [Nanoarchaeota archaeon]